MYHFDPDAKLKAILAIVQENASMMSRDWARMHAALKAIAEMDGPAKDLASTALGSLELRDE